MKKIAGVLIIYNPTSDIERNIATYIDKIDILYIIDNSDNIALKNGKIIRKIIGKSKIQYINFNQNMGIAYSLNYILNKIDGINYEWLLTMDQDSYFQFDDLDKLILSIDDLGKKNDTIIISPVHKTRAIVNKKCIEGKYECVDRVMTSGNLLNVMLAKKINGFEEKLFIDEVDHEFCLRACNYGYKVYLNSEVSLIHGLGKQNKHYFFGKCICFSATHHNALRRYYMTRNRLYVMKLYPKIRKQYLKNILTDFIKIILAEKDKLKKIISMLYAIRDYNKKIFGKVAYERLL